MDEGESSMIQRFEITSAPEAKKITASELQSLLWHYRQDSEWAVLEYKTEDHLAKIAALETILEEGKIE